MSKNEDIRFNLNMCEHIIDMLHDHVIDIEISSITDDPVLVLNFPGKEFFDKYEIQYCPICGKPVRCDKGEYLK